MWTESEPPPSGEGCGSHRRSSANADRRGNLWPDDPVRSRVLPTTSTRVAQPASRSPRSRTPRRGLVSPAVEAGPLCPEGSRDKRTRTKGRACSPDATRRRSRCEGDVCPCGLIGPGGRIRPPGCPGRGRPPSIRRPADLGGELGRQVAEEEDQPGVRVGGGGDRPVGAIGQRGPVVGEDRLAVGVEADRVGQRPQDPSAGNACRARAWAITSRG